MSRSRTPDDPTPQVRPFPVDPAALRWEEAEATLIGILVDDLRAAAEPIPTLLAFARDRALAIVGLRPFGPGEVDQALLEVLALLVPLGADRLAFAATGRVWSLDDPIVPVCDAGDLRQRALVITVADGHDPARPLRGAIHPFEGDGDELTFLPPVAADQVPGGPAATLLEGAVAERHALITLAQEHDLVAQLGRVLLLGHDLALAPDAAAELATVR